MSIEISGLEALRVRAHNTNVNDVTLLATDYLNHFNEALMLAELVIDMPDMLDDLNDWSPISYAEHFLDSGIADRELAIEAYEFSPTEYKSPFEETTKRLNQEIQDLQTNLSSMDKLEDDEARMIAVGQCAVIRRLIEQAGGIINGHVGEMEPHAISTDSVEEDGTLDQDEINAMFG